MAYRSYGRRRFSRRFRRSRKMFARRGRRLRSGKIGYRM